MQAMGKASYTPPRKGWGKSLKLISKTEHIINHTTHSYAHAGENAHTSSNVLIPALISTLYVLPYSSFGSFIYYLFSVLHNTQEYFTYTLTTIIVVMVVVGCGVWGVGV